MGDVFSKAGVVLLEGATKPWKDSARKLLNLVMEYHSYAGKYQEIKPLADHARRDLQRLLCGAVPGLEDFSYQLKKTLDGNCAVFVPNIGLEGFSASERATLAYVIGVCMGNPTATDQRQVVWDVQARKRDSTYFSTFSETDNEAAYHTDTQYYPRPEPLFALYCVEPARCGGGYSSVLDARALRRDLQATRPRLFETLSSKPLPFRVPSAFVTSAEKDIVEATVAPIFSEQLVIRYRRDTLLAGLKYFPEYGDAEALLALDEFDEVLAQCPHQVEFFMPRDSMVFMDNHQGLHARTSFSDHERHLVRIRMMTIDLKDQPLPLTKTISRRVEPEQLMAV